MAVKAIRTGKPLKKSASKGKAKKTALKKKVSKTRNGVLSAIQKKSKGLGELDYTFLLITVVLTIIGLVMLLSASTPSANIKFGKSYYFFIRQFIFTVMGIVFMYAISLVDYHTYKKYANTGILIGIVLLILVLIPHIGIERNGSRRWISLGITDFQPTELVKFLMALFFASAISERRYDLRTLQGLAKYGVWIIAVAFPIMLETHLSGAIVICGIAICLLIIGGANMKYIFMGGAGLLAGGTAVALLIPSRAARLISFIHPFDDPQGKGYQIIQSLYAIGSGGVFGRGLGQSMQKYSYLPEPYNDFIFSIVSEELGFVGAVFIILLFAGLVIRGIKIALEAPDAFGMLLTAGIMSQIAIQTILNIAVVTSSVPNTGVTLPFFSYGGTAMMMLLMEMGVVLNVSRNARTRL
ncbi:MAG: putative lipid II flippase FtsW [Firmicutes bacterium]|nr:putative lipid II flippase FtsW [Bacillota bacterium]